MTLQAIARLSWAKMLFSTIFPFGSSLVTKVEIPGSKVGKIQCVHKVPFLKTPQVPLHIGVGEGASLGLVIFLARKLPALAKRLKR